MKERDVAKDDRQLTDTHPAEKALTVANAGTITTYIPKPDGRKVMVSRRALWIVAFLGMLAPAVGVYVYSASAQRTQEAQKAVDMEREIRELEREQHASHVRMMKEKHEFEVDTMTKQHEAELAAREAVAEARIEQERNKGFYARRIQPWIDWWHGSDTSVKADRGSIEIEVKPKR